MNIKMRDCDEGLQVKNSSIKRQQVAKPSPLHENQWFSLIMPLSCRRIWLGVVGQHTCLCR